MSEASINLSDKSTDANCRDQLTNALGLTSQAPLPTTINPTPLTGHQLPGPNVAQAILTGVPASFYVAMANPSGRASISSAMAAGNMPEW